MASQPLASQNSLTADRAAIPAQSAAPYLFVFLEVFAREGGIQSYVQCLLQSYLTLDDQPHADIFLLRDGQGCANPFQSETLTFHYLKTKSLLWGRIRLMLTLLVYLWQHKPRHVFCGHVNLAPLIWLLCAPLGIPYTVMTHGKEVWKPLPYLARRSLQAADRIWTVSRYSRDRSAAANQLDPRKIELAPCAVDGDRFTPGSKSPALLEHYGLTGASVLMTVTRLWSGDIYKGVDVTIRALPAIAAMVPDVKYLVIGRGDDQPRLVKLTEDLGVADRVVFAGFVPDAELVEHYRLADVYVMPSQEGFGIVYLEAMACGVPVLAGDSDGSADPLRDGQLGWRVPHRDVVAVAAACIKILQAQAAVRQGIPTDRRCDRQWLRQETLAAFGKPAFTERLQTLLTQTAR